MLKLGRYQPQKIQSSHLKRGTKAAGEHAKIVTGRKNESPTELLMKPLKWRACSCRAKKFDSSACLRQVGFGLGRLKLIKHSSNRTSKIYHKRNFFFSFVHFRHPTDEQLQHIDIIFSNYYNLQSVHFVFVLSVPAHLDNWCFFYFAIKWWRLLHIP